MKLACEDFNHFLNDPLFSKELFISSDLQINEYNDFPPTIRAIDETIRKKVLSSTSSDMALENPQDLCNLLLSIKAIICALSSQMLDKIQTDIENAFEMEKIKEELIRNTDNLNSRLSLIINIMGKICSPVRDRQILFLKNKQAPTIAFLKDLFVVLDDMRIDMCNFFLQHHRKKIIEHAVKFELSVFLNYCDNFKNSTNLARTRAWLQKAIETAGISNEGKEINESRVLEIVFIAYKLLLYMEEPEYPETISLDIIRINVINSLFTCSVFVSSLLNILKTHIKDLKLFDELVELKIVNIAFVLKKDEMNDKVKMEKMAREILNFIDCEKAKNGLDIVSNEYSSFFILKMQQLVNRCDPVWQLFEKRIIDAVFSDNVIGTNLSSLHPSIQSLSDAIFRIRNIYTRFINFNRWTYFETYKNIILDLATNKSTDN